MDPRVFRAVKGSSLVAKWERYWFEEVPSEAFALTRIAIGAAGLISLIGFLPVDLFWPLDGLASVPGTAGIRSYLLESGWSGLAGWVAFLTLFGSLVCMTAGLFTGPAVMACFIGSVLQPRWNSVPLSAAHGLLMSMLFCLVWADCGRLSVDERRRRLRSSTATTPEPQPVTPSHQPIWPLRLMRAQVATLYAASGLYKLLGASWRDGSATYHSTHQNVYGRIFYLHPVPPDFEWVFTLMTYGTLLWELSFPLMLLNRMTRRIALATGVMIHLGIWVTMEVGPFSPMILAAYVAFLDPHKAPQVVARLLSWRRSPRLTPLGTTTVSSDSTSAA